MFIKHRSTGIKFQKIQDISIHTNKPQNQERSKQGGSFTLRMARMRSFGASYPKTFHSLGFTVASGSRITVS